MKSDPKADFNSGWDLMVVIAGTEFCTYGQHGGRRGAEQKKRRCC